MDYYERLVAGWNDNKLREQVSYLRRLRVEGRLRILLGKTRLTLEAAEYELISRGYHNA